MDHGHWALCMTSLRNKLRSKGKVCQYEKLNKEKLHSNKIWLKKDTSDFEGSEMISLKTSSPIETQKRASLRNLQVKE